MKLPRFLIAIPLFFAPLCFASLAKAATYKDIVLADSPKYYWTFDEASGNAINHGSGAGGELGGANGQRAASGTTGGGLSLGSASSHNGSSGQWFFTSTTNGGTNLADGTVWSSWAIEFWVQSNGGAEKYLFDFAPNNRPAIINNFGSYGLELNHTNGRTNGLSQDTGLSSDWTHVVVAVKNNAPDNTVVDIYFNNQLVQNKTIASALAIDLTYNSSQVEFIVGASRTGNNRFNGLLDEVALYNLTGASQVDFDARIASIAGHYSAIPEPGGLALLSLAGLLVGVRRRAVSEQ